MEVVGDGRNARGWSPRCRNAVLVRAPGGTAIGGSHSIVQRAVATVGMPDRGRCRPAGDRRCGPPPWAPGTRPRAYPGADDVGVVTRVTAMKASAWPMLASSSTARLKPLPWRNSPPNPAGQIREVVAGPLVDTHTEWPSASRRSERPEPDPAASHDDDVHHASLSATGGERGELCCHCRWCGLLRRRRVGYGAITGPWRPD